MNKYILSLCIPTYNRCEVLNRTLATLAKNPEFNAEQVEVIISDNCSTDDTATVVARYPFAKYFCNKENIKDENFSVALSYATGQYIRLFNDTISFKPGKLRELLTKINSASEAEGNIFFYDNTYFNKFVKRHTLTPRQFIKETSFYTTWIANFGCWRSDFSVLPEKDKYAYLQLVQVDWTYKIISNGKPTDIHFDELFSIEELKNKGGYNIFKVFVSNYLTIIKDHDLSRKAYELEKYRLGYHFVYPWVLKLMKLKSETNFETQNAFKVIYEKYWYEPYFYMLALKFLIHKVKFKIIS